MLSIDAVVRQHVDEGVLLWAIRAGTSRSGQLNALQGSSRDARLAAHLDGLAVAGDGAWPFIDDALQEDPSAGAVFVATVRAIEGKQSARLDDLLALAQSTPGTVPGLLAAFGWVERSRLQGIVANLLGAQDPFRRMVGIATCGMHRVDPGLEAGSFVRDASPSVRARALRTAGELGRIELRAACLAAIEDDDPACQVWAAWAATLLGDRARAMDTLTRVGLTDGPHRTRAFRLALQTADTPAAHEVLRQIAGDSEQARWLVQGSGLAGDPTYVPWLVRQMADPKLARLAGEAFALIAGQDIGQAGLEGRPPDGLESGPTEDPEDSNVDMDPDEGLPWPDPDGVETWWRAHGSRFQAGARYFVGAPVTRAQCLDILRHGNQRQRVLAAHYLCLLEPGTPLFNTSAPAWRQQRELARLD